MRVLPEDVEERLSELGRYNTESKVEAARIVKDYIDEMDRGDEFVYDVYRDAGAAYGVAARTFREYVESIRGYSDKSISGWLDARVPFAVFPIAKRIYNAHSRMDANEKASHPGAIAYSPADVLDAAVNRGDTKPLTVDEIETLFAFHRDGISPVDRHFASLRELIAPRWLSKFDIVERTVRRWIK